MSASSFRYPFLCPSDDELTDAYNHLYGKNAHDSDAEDVEDAESDHGEDLGEDHMNEDCEQAE